MTALMQKRTPGGRNHFTTYPPFRGLPNYAPPSAGMNTVIIPAASAAWMPS